ncbi:MAG: 50S ribosomal protein L25/general stress protein Ctc [Candidatus Zixiibacteriota bacterium]
MEQIKLTAERREDSGKGVARKLRASGFLPGVLYGPEVDPIPITVNNKELDIYMRKYGGSNKLIELNVNSESEGRKVIIRDLQKDPIDGSLQHVDFYQVSMTKELNMNVPIILMGTPEGVKNGGILQHIIRQLEISCLPADIPNNIEIDVTKMDIGDSLHVSSIVIPNVEILTNPSRTFATVVPPTVIKTKAETDAEAAEAAEAAEGEAAAEAEGDEGDDKKE